MRFARHEAFDKHRGLAELGCSCASAKVRALDWKDSKSIRSVLHSAEDYEALDRVLGRPHHYEEGIAFVQGFYDLLDSCWDAAKAKET